MFFLKEICALLIDSIEKELVNIIQLIKNQIRSVFIGIVLIASGILFIQIGFFFILAGCFSQFAQAARFFLPSIWTALIGFGLGMILIKIGCYFLKFDLKKN